MKSLPGVAVENALIDADVAVLCVSVVDDINNAGDVLDDVGVMDDVGLGRLERVRVRLREVSRRRTPTLRIGIVSYIELSRSGWVA